MALPKQLLTLNNKLQCLRWGEKGRIRPQVPSSCLPQECSPLCISGWHESCCVLWLRDGRGAHSRGKAVGCALGKLTTGQQLGRPCRGSCHIAGANVWPCPSPPPTERWYQDPRWIWQIILPTSSLSLLLPIFWPAFLTCIDLILISHMKSAFGWAEV